MKVLLINTYESQGGAAIACKRLLKALNKTTSVKAKLLVDVRQKKTVDEEVYELANTERKRTFRKYRFILQKVLFMPFEISKKERFSFSTARLGTDISKHPLVQDADILHIHWTNHSFLSHENIRQLILLKKPVVVTMHDMWYFTGGCHYSGECTYFMDECGNCKFLRYAHPNDLSHKIWNSKQGIYDDNIIFVACSSWLANVGRTSSLLQERRVINIPNPIDISIFKEQDQLKSRRDFNLPENKVLILYVAAKVDDERKGYKYLSQALKKLYESDTPLKEKLEIIVMGNVKDQQEIAFYFPTHFLGGISDQDKIVSCYNAADLFVAPSLEDNLPNTIIESMACGTPVVAFHTGGIPEIIDHKYNGYLAEYKNTEDLINGITRGISEPELSEKCMNKITNTFSEKVVSAQFTALYQSLLGIPANNNKGRE